MVSAKPSMEEQLENLILKSGVDDEMLAQMQRIMNEPKYLDTAEEEIEKMLTDAKISLSELGFELDRQRMANIDQE